MRSGMFTKSIAPIGYRENSEFCRQLKMTVHLGNVKKVIQFVQEWSLTESVPVHVFPIFSQLLINTVAWDLSKSMTVIDLLDIEAELN